MNRKIYFWKLPSTELAMGERTLIMGVLNVTPDSFSDGGRYSDADGAYARALQMEEQGADIIDIGAESTRPDSKRVSAEEEWRRLLPVLKLLRDKLTVPLSIDTYKSEIAERALQYGVSIFNDPSGLTFDANLAKVAAESNAGLILNHMRGTPETWGKQPALADVMGAVSKDLEATVSRARRAGVEKNRIVVDPGLGFGKRKEQNSEILAHLERLAELDHPILVGPSRKSFLSNVTDGETLFATAAAVAAAVMHGAHMVRVHDVKEMRSAAQIADEIVRTATAWRATQDAANDRAAVPRTRTRTDVEFMREDRAMPPRPPLLKREEPVREVVPQATEIVAAVPEESPQTQLIVAESAGTESPQAQPAEITAETPKVAEPVKVVQPRPPVQSMGDRPVFRRPAADRPPRRDSGDRNQGDRNQGDRRDPGDRPERRDYQQRPAAGRPSGPRPGGDRPFRPAGDRPPRPFGDRPPRQDGDRPFRPAGDRPPRPFGDRPARPGGDRPFRPGGDRPPRPFGDRPARPGGDRPFRPGGDRPPRPFGDRPARPGGDRPFRPAGDRPSRPFGDRPPRPGGDRPFRPAGDRPSRPFGDRPSGPGDRPRNDRPRNDRGPSDGPPRDFRPGGDRPRGDRPPGGDGPNRGGPPRGSGPSRPSGDRPPRPFRKRP